MMKSILQPIHKSTEGLESTDSGQSSPILPCSMSHEVPNYTPRLTSKSVSFCNVVSMMNQNERFHRSSSSSSSSSSTSWGHSWMSSSSSSSRSSSEMGCDRHRVQRCYSDRYSHGYSEGGEILDYDFSVADSNKYFSQSLPRIDEDAIPMSDTLQHEFDIAAKRLSFQYLQKYTNFQDLPLVSKVDVETNALYDPYNWENVMFDDDCSDLSKKQEAKSFSRASSSSKLAPPKIGVFGCRVSKTEVFCCRQMLKRRRSRSSSKKGSTDDVIG